MYQILERDAALRPFERDINLRMDNYHRMHAMLAGGGSLSDFANAHEYYGFHHTADGWVYREWAPGADALYLTGEFNNWDATGAPLSAIGNGSWEIRLPEGTLRDGMRVKTVVKNGDTLSWHIPLYARRVIQDQTNFEWICEVWDPTEPYGWTDWGFTPDRRLFIYESHVGMATEEYRVGTYREFADNTLPWIQGAGYNTVQLMADRKSVV